MMSIHSPAMISRIWHGWTTGEIGDGKLGTELDIVTLLRQRRDSGSD